MSGPRSPAWPRGVACDDPVTVGIGGHALVVGGVGGKHNERHISSAGGMSWIGYTSGPIKQLRTFTQRVSPPSWTTPNAVRFVPAPHSLALEPSPKASLVKAGLAGSSAIVHLGMRAVGGGKFLVGSSTQHLLHKGSDSFRLPDSSSLFRMPNWILCQYLPWQ